VAESRWQRIKRWFIASDPDDLAREEFRRAQLGREAYLAADPIDLRDHLGDAEPSSSTESDASAVPAVSRSRPAHRPSPI
jgi:hypothetical protein